MQQALDGMEMLIKHLLCAALLVTLIQDIKSSIFVVLEVTFQILTLESIINNKLETKSIQLTNMSLQLLENLMFLEGNV